MSTNIPQNVLVPFKILVFLTEDLPYTLKWGVKFHNPRVTHLLYKIIGLPKDVAPPPFQINSNCSTAVWNQPAEAMYQQTIE